MQKYIPLKVVMIVMLAGALLGDFQYFYYQILRWIVMLGGAYLASQAFSTEKRSWGLVYVAMAILFNPIIPFYLAKSTWQSIDLIAGVVLIISIFVQEYGHKS